MPRSHNVIRMRSGRVVEILKPLGGGGQGETHLCREQGSGVQRVLKIMHPQFDTPAGRKRVEFLVAQNLSAVNPVLMGPLDCTGSGTPLAHLSPVAPGQLLEELLLSPCWSFMEGLDLSIALAQAVAVLDARRIWHGDISSLNTMIHRNGHILVAVIDFDNSGAPGVPPPPMAGGKLYMAPEIINGDAPDTESDRWSLAVLIHEILLLKHPQHGFDADENAFVKATMNDRWNQDPSLCRAGAGASGGYPAEVLSPDLARLFRRGFSLNPVSRPPAMEWLAALIFARDHVFACPRCGGMVLIDASKTRCPFCSKDYPLTQLVFDGGRTVACDGVLVIRRSDMGGRPEVSSLHSIIRRVGPEFWLEDMGSCNGTFRRTPDGRWLRLPPSKPVLIQPGDRLRFANVEASVHELT